MPTPAQRFRQALTEERPLQVVGAINAYGARLAEASGFRALYLSGGGVAAASCGLPDLGVTSREDVLIDLRRITAVTKLPVLVDCDTGWGDALGIARTVREMEQAGAAAIHLEDQVAQKRCGHRPNKALVPIDEMVARIEAAVAAREELIIMARTDALAVEGMATAIERAQAYVAAGAELLFPEALTDLDQYRTFCDAVAVPVLANITEFGQTPLFTREQLGEIGVAMALYPLTAFRSQSAAALHAYQTLRAEGTQASLIEQMQTREELYHYLDYHRYEQALDRQRSGGGGASEP